jgi:hypothetical protein
MQLCQFVYRNDVAHSPDRSYRREVANDSWQVRVQKYSILQNSVCLCSIRIWTTSLVVTELALN